MKEIRQRRKTMPNKAFHEWLESKGYVTPMGMTQIYKVGKKGRRFVLRSDWKPTFIDASAKQNYEGTLNQDRLEEYKDSMFQMEQDSAMTVRTPQRYEKSVPGFKKGFIKKAQYSTLPQRVAYFLAWSVGPAYLDATRLPGQGKADLQGYERVLVDYFALLDKYTEDDDALSRILKGKRVGMIPSPGELGMQNYNQEWFTGLQRALNSAGALKSIADTCEWATLSLWPNKPIDKEEKFSVEKQRISSYNTKYLVQHARIYRRLKKEAYTAAKEESRKNPEKDDIKIAEFYQELARTYLGNIKGVPLKAPVSSWDKKNVPGDNDPLLSVPNLPKEDGLDTMRQGIMHYLIKIKNVVFFDQNKFGNLADLASKETTTEEMQAEGVIDLEEEEKMELEKLDQDIEQDIATLRDSNNPNNNIQAILMEGYEKPPERVLEYVQQNARFQLNENPVDKRKRVYRTIRQKASQRTQDNKISAWVSALVPEQSQTLVGQILGYKNRQGGQAQISRLLDDAKYPNPSQKAEQIVNLEVADTMKSD